MNKWIFAFVLLALVSCGQIEGEEENSIDKVELFGQPVPFEVGNYKGVFPCADCPGIERVLTFEKNGNAVVSRFYLDRSTEPELNYGKWLEREGKILFISHWDDDTLRFASHQKGLVLLDGAGEYVLADYQLAQPTSDGISLAGDFIATVRFFYMADAAVAWLHPDERPLPVLMNEAYLPIERSFLLYGDKERECVVVRLLCRLKEELDMEGSLRTHVVPLRLIHMKSGNFCGGK
jgi:copper homeostasis protein (lipoprotein)